MIKAIIFDMDGVLIDSESYHPQIETALMRKFGVKLTPKDLEEYTGMRFEEEFEAFIEKFDLKIPVAELLYEHELLAKKYYEEVFPVMPGVEETLKIFSHQFPLGLATGSPRTLAQMVLKRLKIFQYLSEQVYMEDVKKGKPDPAPFLLAAQKLKISPSHIMVVEDSLKGFKAAKSAGMKLIGFKSYHNRHQDFSQADGVIEDMRELKGFFPKENFSF